MDYKESNLDIKALADLKNMSIRELAEEAGIDPDHLERVSAGKAKMTAKDLLLLAGFTGASPYDIKL